MASISPTPAELGKIAGPLIVAYLLNWGLYGVLSMQVYMYYLAFPNDRIGSKALVYGAYLLVSAQTFLHTRGAFRMFALGFDNPEALDEVDTLWLSPIFSGLVAFLWQAFYAYRIALFSRKLHLSILIMLLACLSVSGSIAVGIDMKSAVLFSHFLKKYSYIVSGVWGGAGTAGDVLIAASMTYYLKRQDTGIRQTHVLLTKIIQLTIETGTVTAALAIVSLILVYGPRNTTYYQTSVAVMATIYSNSMMVAFNSRMKIGPSNNTTAVSGYTFGSIFHAATMRHGMDAELGSRSGERPPMSPAQVSFPPLGEAVKGRTTDFDQEESYSTDQDHKPSAM
ncbi:hypothetical protein GALMADRAFT_1122164 [Galerina marginata CBS 339.88]|uniref:DUF6534 domain-containing protein n=1 Tax=Galerina marginata (strain CBS 339.88) TaxID=685588 RepID=A0A067TQ37_GALM3|nr:hypothetical protein GALMADRAFT_1122164 [Galerina marginata CBS 339.88]